MAAVFAREPRNHEVATLYADALMLLEPRRGVWPLAKPSVARIHGVLEGVLARDVTHPGACHLYIHATETTPRVREAQRCADLLGAAIPGASHILHMPSHTYNRVGRWGDATRVNVQAWHSDQRAAVGEGVSIYPSHNLHMLLFSASMDGQGALAIQAARDFAKLVPTDGAGLHALVLVRFGRFDEVLELTRAPAHPIHRGLWAFARGHAHLRLARPDSARAYLALVDSLARHTPATRMFRVHQPARLLGVVGGILRAELLRVEGRAADAVTAFQEAARLEDALVYDEPEPLPFAVRDWLGTLLLEQGKPADAERIFREALERRPHNGWSLVGLEQALRAQNRTADADGRACGVPAGLGPLGHLAAAPALLAHGRFGLRNERSAPARIEPGRFSLPDAGPGRVWGASGQATAHSPRPVDLQRRRAVDATSGCVADEDARPVRR
jgi:tetratricopeptide (TPR) repeat protein